MDNVLLKFYSSLHGEGIGLYEVEDLKGGGGIMWSMTY